MSRELLNEVGLSSFPDISDHSEWDLAAHRVFAWLAARENSWNKETLVKVRTGLEQRFGPSSPILECFDRSARLASPSRSEIYRVDRIDFVSGTSICHFCRRPLKRRVAYVLIDSRGQEVCCGSTCLVTRANFPRNVECPDFTRASMDVPKDGYGGDVRRRGGPGAVGGTLGKHKRPEMSPEEYLRLRYEKLPGFKGVRIKTLDYVYEKLVSGSLLQSDREAVQRFIAKVRQDRPEYSPENLAACYAYYYWLTVALDHIPNEKRGFLYGMIERLKKHLFLTNSQVEGLNHWLAKIPSVPLLDPSLFCKVSDKGL